MSLPENYSTMSVQERAKFLLSQGLEAKLDIDPDKLEPGFVAYVHEVGKLPCGFYSSEPDAIAAGLAWLNEKAGINPPPRDENDIPVQCTRCRNKHWESERVVQPNSKHRDMVCPRCGGRSYYDLRPQLAWCFASGEIEFGSPNNVPEGAIVIASGAKSYIRGAVSVVARIGHKGKLLVPGVPEAESQKQAGDALSEWLSWCAKGNGRKGSYGVIFYSEENKYVV